jgi:hypothetical protein
VLACGQAAAASALGWISGRVVGAASLRRVQCRLLLDRLAAHPRPTLATVALLLVGASVCTGCDGTGVHVATVSVPAAGAIVINFRMDSSPNSSTATCSGTVTFRVVPGSLGSSAGKDTTQILLGQLAGPPINMPDIENGSPHWVCEIERSFLNLKNGSWSAQVTTPLMVSCSTTVRAGMASLVRIWSSSCL